MDTEEKCLDAEETFAACEKLFPRGDARDIIRRRVDAAYASFTCRVAVLDDDPTGVQTVHDISVYTEWTVDAMVRGLTDLL